MVPKIFTWSIVWCAPASRSSAGRSALTTITGTPAYDASTSDGSRLATAVPLVVTTATGGTAYALVGDLAFLHDHNGLLAGDDEPRPDLVIVVVDNDGGGIFGQLEQAGTPHFERIFGTPLGLDLEKVAAAVAVDHVCTVTDVTALVAAIDEATAAGGVRVVVAKVGDRAAEAQLLRDLQTDVSAALVDLDDLDTPTPG